MPSKVAVTAWAVLAGLTLLACYVCGVWGSCVICLVAGLLFVWLLPSPAKFAESDPALPGKRSWLNDKFKPEKLPKDIDTIVVGSGMGGLSCAAVLARFGHRVVVLEQHDVAGGATHTFDLSGFKFDSGLHYTVPWHGPIFQLTCLRNDVPDCELLGEPDGTFDKVVVGSDKPFNIQKGDHYIHELAKMFPEEQAGINEFIKVTNDILLSVRVFIFSKLLPLWAQNLFWKIVPSRFHPSKDTLAAFLHRTIKNKKLRSLLCGLWIDSGGKPTEASFMLSGAVQRGLPMEGGCYPIGGPEAMGRCLVRTILQYGGRVFVEAPVANVLVNDKTNAVIGVKLSNGTVINAKQVVSATGYHNTFQKLVPADICSQHGIPTQLPVPQSAGFVMCNVGINGTAEEMGVTNTNLWYLPATSDGDIFEPMEQYFQDPLAGEIPCMITWPSMKDAANSPKGKLTCQMLALAENEWFDESKHGTFGNRTKEYEELKAQWQQKFLDVLHRFFPKTKGKVAFSDVSTPLSIKHYLGAPAGAACGLGSTPERFLPAVQKHLDASTPIHGLWLTGQDTTICGVTLAQLAGVITACRMLGLANSIKLFAQSVLFL